MRRKRTSYLQWYAVSTVAGLSFVAALNGLIDPLHFYHRPFLHHTFTTNERFQNPGVIKNYDYDAVVMGDSLCENFRVTQLRRSLGWHTVNLCMSGSTAREQAVALRKALDTGKVRDVLWGLNYDAFIRAVDDLNHNGDFPLFLYEESLETPINYLLSFDTLQMSIRALDGRGPQDIAEIHGQPTGARYCRQSVLQVWRRMHSSGRPPVSSEAPEVRFAATRVTGNVRDNLLPLVKRYPHVRFHLFFPPLSVLSYVNDFTISESRFATRLLFKRQVLEAVADCPNCRLHDFDGTLSVTRDLERYKDLMHYDSTVNDLMIDALRRDADRLDHENCDHRLAEFERSVHDLLKDVTALETPTRHGLQLPEINISFRDAGMHPQ
jgi:hypothetical protein